MTDPTRDTTDTARPAHTPGPWIAAEPLASNRRVFMPDDTIEIRTGRTMIACLYRSNFAGGTDEANARLIAEAPTLAAERDYWNERFEAMRAENARLAAVNADLLAILVELYHPTDGPCRAARSGDWPVHDRARAAIARATGAKC